MPDASDKQDTKTLKIMPWCKAIENLNIAIIARGSTEVKNPERLFEAITFKSHDYKYILLKYFQKDIIMISK
jgi:hypothetical protein